MGFTASICIYEKSRPDITYNDIITISELLAYENNSWAKKHYTTAEEYAKYILDKRYIEQSKEDIDWYRDHLITDEYNGRRVYDMVGYWCSNGSGDIYDYIISKGTPICEESESRILTKHDIRDIMMFCLNKIKEYMPKESKITYAYRYKRNEDGDIPENAEITLFNVDGFEVESVDDEDRRYINRIDTSPEWGCEFGFPQKYFNDWEYSGYEIGLDTCVNILAKIDNWDDVMVVYSGGW